MKKLFCSLFFFISLQANAINWYENFVFKDQSFIYQFIRTLGYAYSGGTDLGECIDTAINISDKNISQWYTQWLSIGTRIYQLGDLFLESHNIISAQEAYFRASNYFRNASFYMNAPPQRNMAISSWKRSRIAFLQAITHIPYIRTVRIPYEKTTLPGYYMSSSEVNAPLLIVNTGFDGTAEELYFAVGFAAHRRGYNVLLVEGPGQGELIKQQKIPFRPDWEHVVTPIINFSQNLPNINKNKIALMGISMGGYLAARAAAFEPRIAAVILNGGVYDMSKSILNTLPSSITNLLATEPKIFDKEVTQAMTQNTNANWFFNNAMWVFNVSSPSAVIQKLREYAIGSWITKIKCPTLVIDSTADTFFKGQPQLVYRQLHTSKTLLIFSPEDAAQAHCQAGAIAISNERILNWLNKTLNWQK